MAKKKKKKKKKKKPESRSSSQGEVWSTTVVKPGVLDFKVETDRIPPPELTFSADQFDVIKVPYGVKILAIQTNPLNKLAADAICVVFETKSFQQFQASLMPLKPGFEKNAPNGPVSSSPINLDALKIRTWQVSFGNLASGGNGIAIDFFHFTQLDLGRVEKNRAEYAQLHSIVRIEALPGRVHKLLEKPRVL